MAKRRSKFHNVPRYIVDEKTGCWVWQHSKFVDGYGYIYCVAQKRKLKAHRVVYEEVKGSIPDGLHLDHLCRNRLCVNPDHLEPVTQAVNTRRGDAAKLNEEVVDEVRRLYATGEWTFKRIAQKFEISISCVSYAITGKSWSDVGDACLISKDNRRNMGRRKLSDLDVEEIRRLHFQCGVSRKVLANQYGVWPQTVDLVVSFKGRFRKDNSNASSNGVAPGNEAVGVSGSQQELFGGDSA